MWTYIILNTIQHSFSKQYTVCFVDAQVDTHHYKKAENVECYHYVVLQAVSLIATDLESIIQKWL